LKITFFKSLSKKEKSEIDQIIANSDENSIF
jgi:hypothetical protein